MRIAFDSTSFLGPASEKQDVVDRVSGLLAEILSRGKHECFFLNLHDAGRPRADRFPNGLGKVLETSLFFGENGSLLGLPAANEAVGDVYRAFIAKNRIDVFVIVAPPDRVAPGYRKEWFDGCRTLALLRDPVPADAAEASPDSAKTAETSSDPPDRFEWADRLVPVSRDAKAEAVERAFAELEEAERPAPAGMKRLAFFSPLPPMKSGISDYSTMLVSGLSRHYEIDAFIDDGYDAPPQVEGIARVFNHGEYFRRRKDYSATVFQMGNSLFHVYMLPYIKKFGGVVVLHDYNMHGTLYTMTAGIDRDMDEYEYLLRKDYPFDVVHDYVEALKAGRTGPAAVAMPTNGFVTKYADKVIVHSFDSKKKLLAKNPALDVRQIFHLSTVAPTGKNERAYARSRIGLTTGDFVFTMFGIVSKAKRTIPVLKAFRRVLASHPAARLALVGEPTPEFRPLLEKAIAELGLQDSVIQTGFATPDVFLDHIRATDVCINLRHPYLGETSGAMIHNIAAGNAVIVNDIGSFGEVPAECCIKLPPVPEMKPEEEIEAIYGAMEKCLAEPDWLATLREKARGFAKENLSVEKCAEDYRNFIEKPVSKGFSEAALSGMARFLVNAEGYEQATEDIGALADTILYAKE